jgi:hypothetical protein
LPLENDAELLSNDTELSKLLWLARPPFLVAELCCRRLIGHETADSPRALRETSKWVEFGDDQKTTGSITGEEGGHKNEIERDRIDPIE